MRIILAAFLFFHTWADLSAEETVRIAVASNFHHTLTALVASYSKSHQDNPSITLVPGSTGKLYAQITNGAPFDAFFAADAKRPELLEKQLNSDPSRRFSYAHGSLALWRPKAPGSSIGETLLGSSRFAMANPKLAPYGLAAAQTLERLELDAYLSKRVEGSNIAHTYSFVKAGAADSGFVSHSQLQQLQIPQEQYLIVPKHLYDPIDQHAIALNDRPAVLAFLEFCKSDVAKDIIRTDGYALPGDS